MSNLAPALPKLRKLIPLLSTDIDGEALACRDAIKRTLHAHGLTFHDLAQAIAATSAPACEPTRQPARNSGAPVWFGMPTERRLDWLDAIAGAAVPSSWLATFAIDIAQRIAECRSLTPAQNAKAQQILEEAWGRGIRP